MCVTLMAEGDLEWHQTQCDTVVPKLTWVTTPLTHSARCCHLVRLPEIQNGSASDNRHEEPKETSHGPYECAQWHCNTHTLETPGLTFFQKFITRSKWAVSTHTC